MASLDPMQKRSLEHDLRAAGLSRSQAKVCVSRVAAAVERGELQVKDSFLAGVLGWWRAGQRKSDNQGQHQAQRGQSSKCACGGACGAACQCASQGQRACQCACHSEAQRDSQRRAG